MNEKLDINPIEDHNPTWDRDEKEISSANEKMTQISKLSKLEDAVDVVKDIPKSITKIYAGAEIKVLPKTAQEYIDIWNGFLLIEPEFKEYMTYGREVIEKLGTDNFIDYMGWNKPEDVGSYRTDIFHTVPCSHCGQYFTTVENDFGLCPICKKEFEIDRFIETISANEVDSPGGAAAIRIMFLMDKEFRNKYLKKTDDERFNDCINEEFKGFDTYRYLKDSLINANGSAVTVCTKLIKNINEKENRKKLEEELSPIFFLLGNITNMKLEDQINFLKEKLLKEEKVED